MITCDVDDSGPATEVTLTGDAVMANAAVLRERLLAATTTGRDVVVDLDGLERLDGAGVQVLLALKIMAEQGGATFTVRAQADVARSALQNAAADIVLCPR